MTNIQHTKYRGRLPQLADGLYLSDGGLETTLIFHDGFDLPMFAAFMLIESERGRAALRAYYDRYVSMAVRHGTGFILESPTWRANPDWGAKLGYDYDQTRRRELRRYRHAACDPRRTGDKQDAARDQRSNRATRRWL